MKVAIIGYKGRMGNLVYKALETEYDIIGFDLRVEQPFDIDILQAIKDEIVVVDFSNEKIAANLVACLWAGYPVISGTTGFSESTIEEFIAVAKETDTKFYWSPNYAKGIDIFKKMAIELAKEYKHVDLIEAHHIAKHDIPSGTAILLAEALDFKEDQIQSLRLNNTNASHEIIFSSAEEKISIKHEVINREAFLKGFYQKFKEFIKE